MPAEIVGFLIVVFLKFGAEGFRVVLVRQMAVVDVVDQVGEFHASPPVESTGLTGSPSSPRGTMFSMI